MDKIFIVVFQAHSKWPTVIHMSSTSAPKTITVLQSLLAKDGLSEQLISDNGTQFTSDEFVHFMKVNGMKHIYSACYHPHSNSLTQRFIQTFKSAMKTD